ncbi:5-(carboxyamino)imidazole ribonucleotide mutase [Thiocystis violascens]|uniref:N5-carboxyaminoimidazole ribonucleotide mutase n=1 Tax=Thiocystis violascens (strain ATCC 17096 / DSM 198 / 6111) TaxID=765911 RepID=I3YDX4_THIV6|nr:5-(carboxyamino)imidazole ribonucleotide mutase [Thiocystis violascens]AFL75192.1 5-(carboxyamino)imidazole ribonucleotide mutase [Thiocystis violascens DSM 198]
MSQSANHGLPLVGIIMGSDSDLPVMREAAEILTEFGVPHEMTIVSAHRTPRRLYEYAESAVDRGLRVIVAGAGGAAHLPGMAAAITPLPVIGVPVKSACLSGEDSLLSIVQMPPGVPVATVAINGAKNAGILAVQILGASDPAMRERIVRYKRDLEAMVMEKVAKLEQTARES